MPENIQIGYTFEPYSARDEFITADEEFEEPQSPQWERNSADRMSLGSPHNGAQDMFTRAREMASIR